MDTYSAQKYIIRYLVNVVETWLWKSNNTMAILYETHCALIMLSASSPSLLVAEKAYTNSNMGEI